MFSPSVTGWSKSKCWENISCVALCEYINDPNHVKKRKGELVKLGRFFLLKLLANLSENAKNSDIPQSYLLITNNELVRVRYLLIYGHKKTPSSKSLTTSAVSEEVPRMSFMAWCRKNPLIVSAVLYVSSACTQKRKLKPTHFISGSSSPTRGLKQASRC